MLLFYFINEFIIIITIGEIILALVIHCKYLANCRKIPIRISIILCIVVTCAIKCIIITMIFKIEFCYNNNDCLLIERGLYYYYYDCCCNVI